MFRFQAHCGCFSPLADSAAAEKPLLFMPGQLTDGIEQSDDPLVDVRDGAYAVSFSRRNP